MGSGVVAWVRLRVNADFAVTEPEARVTREARSSSGRQLEIERLPAHRDALFRAACALCGSRQDAEDLVQETYAQVMSRPRFLRRDDDLAYLMRALRNTWIDLVRSRAAHPTVGGLNDLDFVAVRGADLDVVLQARAAYAAISELPESLRETIVAVDIVGLSYKEAARSLKTPKGTIMSRLYHAREQVAASLGGPA